MALYSAVCPLPVNRIKNRLFDPDARDYILRVEAADGERLESQVRGAINSFVIGCKADGIWTALTNSCIMAGARTVAGAIIPLQGIAPTNNNFVIGDYNRKTGLIGNSSTKTLVTAYPNNILPVDNVHISCYVTQAPTIGASSKMFIGNGVGLGGRLWLLCNNTSGLNLKNRTSPTAGITIALEGITTGFKGHSRNSSINTTIRTSQTNTVDATISASPTAQNTAIFSGAGGTLFSDARMSFYSLGTNIDLALLDTRITTLMNTLASVIA